jgi:hypothetical protein
MIVALMLTAGRHKYRSKRRQSTSMEVVWLTVLLLYSTMILYGDICWELYLQRRYSIRKYPSFDIPVSKYQVLIEYRLSGVYTRNTRLCQTGTMLHCRDVVATSDGYGRSERGW